MISADFKLLPVRGCVMVYMVVIIIADTISPLKVSFAAMTAYRTCAGVMGIIWVQLLAQSQDTPLTSCQTHTLCWWHFRWLSKDDRKYSFRSFLPPTTWPRHLRPRRAVRSPGSDSLSTLLIDLPHGGSEKPSVSRSDLCLFIKVFIHYRHRPQKCVSRKFAPYFKLREFFALSVELQELSIFLYPSFSSTIFRFFPTTFFSNMWFWCKSSPINGAIWTVYLLKMCICEAENVYSVCARAPDKEAEVLVSLPKVPQRPFLPLRGEERKALKIIVQAGTQSSHQEWAEPETHFQKSPKTNSAVTAINTKYSSFCMIVWNGFQGGGLHRHCASYCRRKNLGCCKKTAQFECERDSEPDLAGWRRGRPAAKSSRQLPAEDLPAPEARHRERKAATSWRSTEARGHGGAPWAARDRETCPPADTHPRPGSESTLWARN